MRDRDELCIHSRAPADSRGSYLVHHRGELGGVVAVLEVVLEVQESSDFRDAGSAWTQRMYSK